MSAFNLAAAVNPEQIARCEKVIRPYIRRTPVIDIDAADIGLDFGRLCLKLELFQHSGSFKTRGAFSNLLTRGTGRRRGCSFRRQPWRRGRLCRDGAEGARKDLHSKRFFEGQGGPHPGLRR
jgi:hypothetical protein